MAKAPCIRCAKRSSITRTLSYGEGRYELDLCPSHSMGFSSDMWTWLNTAWEQAPAAPLTDCDRCGASDAAMVSLRFEGDLYLTYLCDQHADLLQLDVLLWVRDGRLLDVNDSQFTRPAKPGPGLRPAPTIQESVSSQLPTSITPRAEQAWWPTQTAVGAMERLGVTWIQVCEELGGSVVRVPSRREGVTNWLTDSLSVLTSADGHVIGLAKRDDDRAEYVARTVAPTAKIERRGKRGGIGNVQPRTTEQILEAIDAAPGWRRERGGKHWKITGPDGQTATIAMTASDYRSAMNAWSQLRRLGITTAHSA